MMTTNESCTACGLCFGRRTEEPDPCVGYLPGVFNACCGHGDASHAYITFGFGKYGHENYTHGRAALEIMRSIRTALGDQAEEQWHFGGNQDLRELHGLTEGRA